MTSVFPIGTAFALNLYGVSVFRTAKPPPSDARPPLMSSWIFLLGVSIILVNINFYSSNYRKLLRAVLNLYQFIVSLFILEVALHDFWFPLEVKAMRLLPKIAMFLLMICNKIGVKSPIIKQYIGYLKDDFAKMIWCYMLSFLFFCSVLHAVRIADFRILRRCGYSIFLQDLLSNLKRMRQKFMKNFKKRGHSQQSFCPVEESANDDEEEDNC